ncbi:MAG: hypothetical protein NC093_08585 [Alistipes sp.]|nr:hypothetical protein [Alistipes sp.]
MNKLTELLSDEESMRQIRELAEMLSKGDTDGIEEQEEAPDESPETEAFGDMPDIETMMKLTSLMGKLNESDENTGLLLALKPHLSEKRRQRVDKAVKLLRLMAVFDMARESGMLGEMF